MRVSNRDLISDTLPFGRPWYAPVSDAVEYAEFTAVHTMP
jgi:hypothetical protein